MNADTVVWVLSDETPFDDPEESGGLVIGAFASAAAALWSLSSAYVSWESFHAIDWQHVTSGLYYGWHPNGTVYVLSQHRIAHATSPETDPGVARFSSDEAWLALEAIARILQMPVEVDTSSCPLC